MFILLRLYVTYRLDSDVGAVSTSVLKFAPFSFEEMSDDSRNGEYATSAAFTVASHKLFAAVPLLLFSKVSEV